MSVKNTSRVGLGAVHSVGSPKSGPAIIPARGLALLALLALMVAGTLAVGAVVRGQLFPAFSPAPSQPTPASDGRVKGLDDAPVVVYCKGNEQRIDVYRLIGSSGSYLHSFTLDELKKAASGGVSVTVDTNTTLTLTAENQDHFYLSFTQQNVPSSMSYFGKWFTCQF
jgi:hypothetical protein